MADPQPMQLHLVSADPTEAELRALFVALTGREPTPEEIAEAQADADTEASPPAEPDTVAGIGDAGGAPAAA